MLPLEYRSGPSGLAGPAQAQPSNTNLPLPVIVARHAMLIAEHDDLDCAITALLRAGSPDDLLIKRLKKRKLQLKDEIALMPSLSDAANGY